MNEGPYTPTPVPGRETEVDARIREQQERNDSSSPIRRSFPVRGMVFQTPSLNLNVSFEL